MRLKKPASNEGPEFSAVAGSEEATKGDVERSPILGLERIAEEAFDVSGVDGCHPRAESATVGCQTDQNFPSVALCWEPFEQPSLDQATDDPIARAVGDEQPIG